MDPGCLKGLLNYSHGRGDDASTLLRGVIPPGGQDCQSFQEPTLLTEQMSRSIEGHLGTLSPGLDDDFAALQNAR
jgi:hypothetical protein